MLPSSTAVYVVAVTLDLPSRVTQSVVTVFIAKLQTSIHRVGVTLFK